ncbi:MAG: ribbon-helix-helix protein, CopG family [Limisphaerales bacterium]
MHVTLDAETVALLDAHCQRWGVTRVEALRRCIAEALTRERALEAKAKSSSPSSVTSETTVPPLVQVSAG